MVDRGIVTGLVAVFEHAYWRHDDIGQSIVDTDRLTASGISPLDRHVEHAAPLGKIFDRVYRELLARGRRRGERRGDPVPAVSRTATFRTYGSGRHVDFLRPFFCLPA
jgi:hypothetical protein